MPDFPPPRQMSAPRHKMACSPARLKPANEREPQLQRLDRLEDAVQVALWVSEKLATQCHKLAHSHQHLTIRRLQGWAIFRT
jgi:hypothetical protein